MSSFEQQLAEYAWALGDFRAEHDLPNEWFAIPDHVAIKCADASDFEETIAAWLPKAAELSYVHLNGRRLATARLLGPITVGEFGSVEWLEIMEPRPEKVGLDPVGIDHMEFLFADFTAATSLLDEKGIPFEVQENLNHKWLSIVAHGHEFKLNNRVLAAIIKEELTNGEATVL